MSINFGNLIGAFSTRYVRNYMETLKATEKIKYYIYDAFSLIDSQTGTYSWEHDDDHEKFIDYVFKSIDDEIDLDFERTTDISKAHIEIYRVSPYSNYVAKDGLLGLAIASNDSSLIRQGLKFQSKQLGTYQLVFWSQQLSSGSPFVENYNILRHAQAHTIIHEIGHALGLSHPQSGTLDDPTGSWHDDRDTVMSYNENPNYDSYRVYAKPIKWSLADIYALKSIWGSENDYSPTNPSTQSNSGPLSGTVNYPLASYKYIFYNLGGGRYGIQEKGSSGIDEITGASSLKFADQTLNTANDVAATFNQVKGKDDVSGVVFRLYNAAFSRLPDANGLQNWIKGNAAGHVTYASSAQSFSESQEFKNRYGSNVTDNQFITTLYNNVLGRAPDAAGLSHYQSLLAGGRSRGALLLDFSESPENRVLFTRVTGLA